MAIKNTLKKGNKHKKDGVNGSETRMTKTEEKTMEDFILYLFSGYKKYGGDRHVESLFYITIRYLTAKIGEYKNLKISEKAEKILGKCDDLKMVRKARRANPRLTIQEHEIPVKKFWDEFRTKKDFTENDAKRWLSESSLAIITEKEDERLTEKGWKEERPKDAYKILGIKLRRIW